MDTATALFCSYYKSCDVRAGAQSPVSEECRALAHWLTIAKTGDEAGYRWLMDRYRDRAVRLAAHVLHNSDEAEDVAQEAFVKAFRSLESLADPTRFYPWLCKIVVRVCTDRLRLRRRQVKVASIHVLEEQSTPGPDGLAEPRILVAQLMAQITPATRAALVLREIDGLDYSEIAIALNVPVGTVRSRLASARGQFAALVHKMQIETGERNV